MKEQRVSYEDNSRPGDVYHPDFQHGCPAYFDVSVHSTTQPSHISFSSCAGVAAAAGELAKDQRHQDAVEEAGCATCCRNFWFLVTICSSDPSYHR